jgi:glycosyltransferase involved in cell wall biosynthesis
MISVVIPAYNEDQYLFNALDSLVNQITNSPFEVIVVDNNSTDQTVEIAQKYSNKLDLRIVTEKKQGILHARNKGFDSAKGEIIARLDADSVADPTWIALMQKYFNEEGIVGLAGSFYYTLPLFRNRYISTGISLLFFKTLRILSGSIMMLGFNSALRRSAWEKIPHHARTTPESRHEDFDLAIHLNHIGTVVYKPNLIVGTSARRIFKSPFSFFFVYAVRVINNMLYARRYSVSA